MTAEEIVNLERRYWQTEDALMLAASAGNMGERERLSRELAELGAALSIAWMRYL